MIKIMRSVSDIKFSPCALCIGKFDGVHRGHQALLKAMTSSDSKLKKTVLSFHPHPMEVLQPEKDCFKVQQSSEMPGLLSQYGVDLLIWHPFTKSFAELSPKEFVTRWLVPYIQPQLIVVGENFRFGCGKSGNVDLLKSYGEELRFKVLVVPTVLDNKNNKGNKDKTGDQLQRISSTVVRKALSQGHITYASQLLGRPYFLEGACQTGDGVGRTLGFPTLNIPLEEKLSIRSGVYICHLVSEGKRHPCIANIGRAPTIHKNRPPLLEVHMFNFVSPQGIVQIEFQDFLRPEIKFPGTEELVHQIQKDVEKAKAFFSVGIRKLGMTFGARRGT